VSAHPLIGRRRFVAACISPYPDESLLGFVTRGLRLTAVRQLKAGLKAAGAARPEPVAIATTLSDPAQIASLAEAFGCDPEDIRTRIYAPGTFDHSTTDTLNFFGTKIRWQYLETKIRRVAPRALQAEPYHRAPWQFRPFSFYASTRELLLDTCPICNRKGRRCATGASTKTALPTSTCATSRRRSSKSTIPKRWISSLAWWIPFRSAKPSRGACCPPHGTTSPMPPCSNP
jgi:hypothetical protein